MRTVMVGILFLAAALNVMAAEKVVLDEVANPRGTLKAKFYMEPATGDGYVTLKAYTSRYSSISNGPRRRVITTYFTDAKVEGLKLVDNKVIYETDGRSIECGTYGLSRIFRVPTIYPSGDCKLVAKRAVIGGQKHLQVILVTK